MDHALRRDRLSARLAELDLEALLVTRLVNVRYLTGFTGSNAQFLMAREPIFFTDSRYEEQARHEVPDLRRWVYGQSFPEDFAKACRDAGVTKLGFEAAAMTYETHQRLSSLDGLELVPTSGEVERLRWSKEPEEIRLLEAAQRITDEAFEAILGSLVEGVTERAIALELELWMRRAGAERLAFESIVAFGEQAAEPHHHPTDRALRRGDVVKIDFGCVVDGYHSDMTRTVAFGEPSGELREIYDLVVRAQAAGIDAVRAGVVGTEADAVARGLIEEAGQGERFGHSLGHGVGLEIHEGPTLRKGSDEVVPEAAVVTVEPGVYVPGVGGVRIEDMVVVEADGCRPLPSTSKELIVL